MAYVRKYKVKDWRFGGVSYVASSLSHQSPNSQQGSSQTPLFLRSHEHTSVLPPEVGLDSHCYFCSGSNRKPCQSPHSQIPSGIQSLPCSRSLPMPSEVCSFLELKCPWQFPLQFCLQPSLQSYRCAWSALWDMWFFPVFRPLLMGARHCSACHQHMNSVPSLKQITLPFYRPGSSSSQHSAPSHAANKLWGWVGALA